ncbi:MAG: hypothetical protein ABSH20_16385 [Tepidisphaeraceae bacterium]|jgi:hypothetical protein
MRKPSPHWILAGCGSLLLVAATSLAGAAPATTRPVEKLPPQVSPAAITVSRDGVRYAYIKRTLASLVPVVDGRAQPATEWIANNLLLFSADSGHTFYIARGRNNARVVLDGTAGPLFDSVDDWLFTPAGRLMYLARQKGLCVIVCDGLPRAQLARVRLGALADAPDAFAFVDMTDTGERVYRNNHPEPVYQHVADVRLSPSGLRLAYRAQHNGRWMMVLDHAEKAPCEDVSAPVFSADSAHVAWLVTRDGKSVLVLDDVETPLGPAGELSPPVLSPDGRQWLAAIRREGKTQVYSAGKPLGVYASIASPAFSPDGGRLAFIAVDGAGKNRVVLDGRETEPADFIFDLRFSPDSRRFAYATTVGNRDTLWVDGKLVGSYDAIAARTLAFSPDSRFYAVAVKQGAAQQIVYDGGATQRFDAVAAGQPLCIDAGNNLHAFAISDGRLMSLTVSLNP